jgi:hypothetical protein
MTSPDTASFTCGIMTENPTIDPAPAKVMAGRPSPRAASNPLERLIQIMQSNDRLMEELAASRDRIARARAYLDEPGRNARMGSAHLERCRVKHSGILARLRANRVEALGLLGRDSAP